MEMQHGMQQEHPALTNMNKHGYEWKRSMGMQHGRSA
jgi:hypothetical protein